MGYNVWFLWNNRGASVVAHACMCEMPEGFEVSEISKGFWIDDTDIMKFRATFACEPNGKMWVPPSRITGIVKRGESFGQN